MHRGKNYRIVTPDMYNSMISQAFYTQVDKLYPNYSTLIIQRNIKK